MFALSQCFFDFLSVICHFFFIYIILTDLLAFPCCYKYFFGNKDTSAGQLTVFSNGKMTEIKDLWADEILNVSLKRWCVSAWGS